jgi:hypothetical protein
LGRVDEFGSELLAELGGRQGVLGALEERVGDDGAVGGGAVDFGGVGALPLAVEDVVRAVRSAGEYDAGGDGDGRQGFEACGVVNEDERRRAGEGAGDVGGRRAGC